MALTQEQNALVKADIAANSDLNTLPNNSDGSFEIARLYNLPAVPEALVWATKVPVKNIYDAIDWSKYTPNDVADGTALFTNRALVIQTKQMNLQNMLQGRDTIDASKANIRLGLRDAVINLPSGNSGAMTVAGGASGVTVLTACTRKATRLEKLLSVGTAAAGGITASLVSFEGTVNYQDMDIARAS